MATRVVEEVTINGFAMDDERLRQTEAPKPRKKKERKKP